MFLKHLGQTRCRQERISSITTQRNYHPTLQTRRGAQRRKSLPWSPGPGEVPYRAPQKPSRITQVYPITAPPNLMMMGGPLSLNEWLGPLNSFLPSFHFTSPVTSVFGCKTSLMFLEGNDMWGNKGINPFLCRPPLLSHSEERERQ